MVEVFGLLLLFPFAAAPVSWSMLLLSLLMLLSLLFYLPEPYCHCAFIGADMSGVKDLVFPSMKNLLQLSLGTWLRHDGRGAFSQTAAVLSHSCPRREKSSVTSSVTRSVALSEPASYSVLPIPAMKIALCGFFHLPMALYSSSRIGWSLGRWIAWFIEFQSQVPDIRGRSHFAASTWDPSDAAQILLFVKNLHTLQEIGLYEHI